jgi:hypothetical protein
MWPPPHYGDRPASTAHVSMPSQGQAATVFPPAVGFAHGWGQVGLNDGINMIGLDKLQRIAEVLEDDYVVSIRPDLPELFEGPDVLAGRNGRLVAVFVPKIRELRRPDRLLTRLVLSRLALPDHVTCVLAISDSSREDVEASELNQHFHTVVSLDDPNDLRRARKKQREDKSLPEASRRLTEQRAAFLLELATQQSLPVPTSRAKRKQHPYKQALAQLAPHADLGHPDPAFIEPMRSDMATRFLAATWVYRGVLVADGVRAEQPLRQRMLPYLTLARKMAFRVDKGIPYLNLPTAGVFVTTELPSSPDPIKPWRASAFAGWALLTNPSPDQIVHLVEATSDWLRATASERA